MRRCNTKKTLKGILNFSTLRRQLPRKLLMLGNLSTNKVILNPEMNQIAIALVPQNAAWNQSRRPMPPTNNNKIFRSWNLRSKKRSENIEERKFGRSDACSPKGTNTWPRRTSIWNQKGQKTDRNCNFATRNKRMRVDPWSRAGYQTLAPEEKRILTWISSSRMKTTAAEERKSLTVPIQIERGIEEKVEKQPVASPWLASSLCFACVHNPRSPGF